LIKLGISLVSVIRTPKGRRAGLVVR